MHKECSNCRCPMKEIILFSSSIWECSNVNCKLSPKYKKEESKKPPYLPKSGWQSMQKVLHDAIKDVCKHGTDRSIFCALCAYGDDLNDPLVTSDM